MTNYDEHGILHALVYSFLEGNEVANSPQAIKRARQLLKRRLHNQMQKSKMRTAIKQIDKLIAANDKDKIDESHKKAVVLIDTLAGRNVIPANTAARIKSRINKRVRTCKSA